jgi:hypothetical protein
MHDSIGEVLMSAKPSLPLIVVAMLTLAFPAAAMAASEPSYRVTILDGDTVIDESVRPISSPGAIKMEHSSSTPLIAKCGKGPATRSTHQAGLDVEVRPTAVANQIKVDYEIRLRSVDPQAASATGDCSSEPPKAKVSRSAGSKTIDPSQEVVLGEVGNYRVKFGLVGR